MVKILRRGESEQSCTECNHNPLSQIITHLHLFATLSRSSINGNVGFSAHIGGMLGGVLMAWFERSGRYKVRRWR